MINDKVKIQIALNMAKIFGQCKGADQKMWCIDQMVGTLLQDDYKDWIKEYCEDGKYEWNQGVPPNREDLIKPFQSNFL